MFDFKIESLRTRMLLWVFCASVIPYIIGGAYIGQVVMEHTEVGYVRQAREVINNIQHNLDYAFLSPVENLVSTLAQDERIMNISPEKLNNYTQFGSSNFSYRNDPLESTLNRYFTTVKYNHKNIGTVFLGSAWGGYMETPHFFPKNAYDPRLRSWYQETLQYRGQISTTDPYVTSVTNEMVISITHTVDRGAENLGVIGVMLYLTEFQNMVSHTKIGETGYLMVLNPNNKFVVSPKHPEWLMKTPEEINIEALKGFEEKVNTLVPYQTDNKDQIMLINPSDTRGWKVIAVIDRAELTGQAIAIRNIIIGVYSVTLLLVLLTITYVTTRITRPLTIMTGLTTQMAHGNLEITEISVATKDELGQLAESFSTMAKSLKKSYTDLELRIEERTAELMERRKAEAALAASEEKFSKAFLCSSDAIGIIRIKDWCYREVSDAFINIFGYSREDIIGKTSSDFNLWLTEEARLNCIQEYMDKGFMRGAEICWCTKAGEMRFGALSMEMINISGESFCLFVWHDITEWRQAEEALREARDHLEFKVEVRTQELIAANLELQVMNEELVETLNQLKRTQDQLVKTQKMAALGGLVAGVAHEINTPAGVALTAASHLEEITKELSELYESKNMKRRDFEEYIEESGRATHVILSNLKRADQLIRSFKQVSVDQASEARRLFKVKNYIEEILLSLSAKLKKTRHIVSVDCDESLEFDSFPGGFSQIITNLIINALNHGYRSSDVGHIVITIVKEEFHLILKFSDDGKGMEEGVLEKIFDPFFTTKRNAGGSGLGLHIVYNIVTQQFKGTIECQSSLNQGTVFTIIFPLKTSDNENKA